MYIVPIISTNLSSQSSKIKRIAKTLLDMNSNMSIILLSSTNIRKSKFAYFEKLAERVEPAC